MICLSELLLRHHEVTSFDQLMRLIAAKAREGERFLRFDVRPPFTDTPHNWEDRLEAMFTAAHHADPDRH